MSTADELKKLAALLEKGLLTREEFEAEKQTIMLERRIKSGTNPDITRSTQPRIGESIGEYQLSGILGEGGMGVVYRARHRSEALAQRQGGEVALKVLHSQYSSSRVYQERFEREATLGVKLIHPGIVTVFDFIVDGGHAALAMELVDGKNMSQVIGLERGPIPWAEALPWFEQLLVAVSYAHKEGVIHRDLKPENVMVTDDGTLKVLDFGIAKQVGEGRTKTGTGMGTVSYMAPEQYTDASSIDARADVYALGMTLYEILAGRLPWESNATEFSILNQKVNGIFSAPTAYYPDIPPELVGIVMSAIEVKPEKRIGSVQELQQRVHDFIHREEKARDIEAQSALRAPKETVTAPSAKPEQKKVAAESNESVAPLNNEQAEPTEALNLDSASFEEPVALMKKNKSVLRWAIFGGATLCILMVGAVAAMVAISSALSTMYAPLPQEKIVIDDEDSGVAQTRFVRATSLSLREEPHKDAKKLNLIPFGTPIRTERLPNSRWHYLLDFQGYVHGDYLSLRPSSESKLLTLKRFKRTKGEEVWTEHLQLELKSEKVAFRVDGALGAEEDLSYMQQGTYTVRQNGLEVTLNEALSDMGTIAARSLRLEYDSDLRGFVTQELRGVQRRADKTIRKRKSWLIKGRDVEESQTIEYSWWYVDQSQYLKERRTMLANRIHVAAALQKYKLDGGYLSARGYEIWGGLTIRGLTNQSEGSTRPMGRTQSSHRKTVYSVMGHPEISSPMARSQRFDIRVGPNNVRSLGHIEVVFDEDWVQAIRVEPALPPDDFARELSRALSKE